MAAQVTLDNKAYSQTLLLPKTSFPLWTHPSKSEVPWRKKTCEDLYRWQWENVEGPLFVLHDGPPYANGNLHIGHALNKILKDIISRYHVSLGHRVHYIPGWDCHGLPIENKALQELKKSPLALPPTTIRKAALATANREIASQKEQFRQLGIMADWDAESGVYRTLDHEYEIRQLRVFQKMVENDLIYTAHRPVFYSPSSHSALAEAELVYKEDHISTSVYITFELHTNGSLLKDTMKEGEKIEVLVWTTTPWTLSANMAIAVHPELRYSILRRNEPNDAGIVIVARERVKVLSHVLGSFRDLGDIPGSALIGHSYKPIFNGPDTHKWTYKIVPAPHVTCTSGTGLVHCAPAHGSEDYTAFKALDLLTAFNSSSSSMMCHVDLQGKFTEDIVGVVGEEGGRTLVGVDVLKGGSERVLDVLKELGGGKLVVDEKVKHRYPYDWKTDEPVIVLATEQWFANLDGIKEDAMSVLEGVQFHPAASRKRLSSHIATRSEWCISRQRVWGVPIPSLHHTPSNRVVLDSSSLDYILVILEEKGAAYWWDGPVEEFLPPHLKAEGGEWRKGSDTMDVWFDSGTSWSMLRKGDLGDGERKFDADVCLEGSDQHRGWFQSMLLTAVGSSCGAVDRKNVRSPYGTLITHGMVLDEQGKKMSKSLGNIMSPMTIVNGGKDKKKDPPYGADALRLWVATVEYAHDMSIGPTILGQCAEALRRVRNSARFILGNVGTGLDDRETVARGQLGLAERYVMHELYKLESVAREAYGSYNFLKAVNALTNFASITLSSLYFDITKDCLYANSKDSLERRAVVTVLEQILKTLVSIMAPIVPHLAEEIYHALPRSAGHKASVFMTKWKPLSEEWEDPQAEEDMNELLRVRGVVLSVLEKARGQKQIKSSLEAEVDLVVPGDLKGEPKLVSLLQREEEFLKTLFIVSDASLTDEGSLGTSSPEWVYTDSVSLSGCDEELGVRARSASLSKCPRCWTFAREEKEALCTRCHSVVG